jgi:hypothetical protein
VIVTPNSIVRMIVSATTDGFQVPTFEDAVKSENTLHGH